MGFLTPQPFEGTHYCNRPERPGTYGAGVRWQCDDCGATYRVELVQDRNLLQLEWVREKPAARKSPPA